MLSIDGDLNSSSAISTVSGMKPSVVLFAKSNCYRHVEQKLLCPVNRIWAGRNMQEWEMEHFVLVLGFGDT